MEKGIVYEPNKRNCGTDQGLAKNKGDEDSSDR
jgi:hypothetical protein